MDLIISKKIFKYIAGDLSLDFVNTVSGDRSSGFTEHIVLYDDLLAWALGAGLINHDQAVALSRSAQSQVKEAHEAVTHAVRLRELIHQLFYAAVHGLPQDPKTLEEFNQELEKSLCRQVVHLHNGELHLEWRLDDQDLDGFLAPVVGSAAVLLTSGNLNLVKICGGDNCGWMFVDQTKNHSRRWCTMDDCGNVAKVRRYRGRSKGLAG